MKSIFDSILLVTESKNRQVGGTSYHEQELYDCVRYDIENMLDDAELLDEINIIELWVHGSRMRGDFRQDSDIDIVMFYEGDEHEDYLFDLLNHETDDPIYIEGHRVDICPVQVKSISDIKRYKQKSDKYDKEKLGHWGGKHDAGRPNVPSPA